MKLKEMLDYIDDLRPNSYGTDNKLKWINEIEADVVKMICKTEEGKTFVWVPYKDIDMDKTLLMPNEYSDAYYHYILAKIYYNDDEISRYNNEIQMFNNIYSQFKAEYTRNHRHASISIHYRKG